MSHRSLPHPLITTLLALVFLSVGGYCYWKLPRSQSGPHLTPGTQVLVHSLGDRGHSQMVPTRWKADGGLHIQFYSTSSSPLGGEVVEGTVPLGLVGLTSDTMPPSHMTRWVRTKVLSRLSSLSATVVPTVVGGEKGGLSLQFSPKKLSSQGLTSWEVARSLQERGLHYRGRLQDTRDAWILTSQGREVALSEVGKVNFGLEKSAEEVVVQGRKGVYLPVYLRKGRDIQEGWREVEDKLAALVKEEKEAGHNLEVTYLRDSSGEGMAPVWHGELGLAVGLVLVMVAVGVYWTSWPAALFIGLLVLLSVAGVGVGLTLWGGGLSFFTLGGMAMVLAVLLPQGVVLVASVQRHIADGLSPRDSAARGAAENRRPLVVALIPMLALFALLVGLSGLSRRLFAPWGQGAFWAAVWGPVFLLAVVPSCVYGWFSGPVVSPSPPSPDPRDLAYLAEEETQEVDESLHSYEEEVVVDWTGKSSESREVEGTDERALSPGPEVEVAPTAREEESPLPSSVEVAEERAPKEDMADEVPTSTSQKEKSKEKAALDELIFGDVGSDSEASRPRLFQSLLQYPSLIYGGPDDEETQEIHVSPTMATGLYRSLMKYPSLTPLGKDEKIALPPGAVEEILGDSRGEAEEEGASILDEPLAGDSATVPVEVDDGAETVTGKRPVRPAGEKTEVNWNSALDELYLDEDSEAVPREAPAPNKPLEETTDMGPPLSSDPEDITQVHQRPISSGPAKTEVSPVEYRTPPPMPEEGPLSSIMEPHPAVRWVVAHPLIIAIALGVIFIGGLVLQLPFQKVYWPSPDPQEYALVVDLPPTGKDLARELEGHLEKKWSKGDPSPLVRWMSHWGHDAPRRLLPSAPQGGDGLLLFHLDRSRSEEVGQWFKALERDFPQCQLVLIPLGPGQDRLAGGRIISLQLVGGSREERLRIGESMVASFDEVEGVEAVKVLSPRPSRSSLPQSGSRRWKVDYYGNWSPYLELEVGKASAEDSVGLVSIDGGDEKGSIPMSGGERDRSLGIWVLLGDGARMNKVHQRILDTLEKNPISGLNTGTSQDGEGPSVRLVMNPRDESRNLSLSPLGGGLVLSGLLALVLALVAFSSPLALILVFSPLPLAGLGAILLSQCLRVPLSFPSLLGLSVFLGGYATFVLAYYRHFSRRVETGRDGREVAEEVWTQVGPGVILGGMSSILLIVFLAAGSPLAVRHMAVTVVGGLTAALVVALGVVPGLLVVGQWEGQE